MHLYDVGRSVNRAAIARKLGIRDIFRIDHGKDTPESLLLPEALVVPMDDIDFSASRAMDTPFTRVFVRAKIYQEGVITIEVRAECSLELEDIHLLRAKSFELDGTFINLDRLAETRFRSLMERIKPDVIEDQYVFSEYEHDRYGIYCLLDPVGDPLEFLERHRSYLAPFLLGEDPSMRLHESQITETLRHPFSFSSTDVAVFDLDRAFIIGPQRDYEDLILIVEHANYRLLELRTLDKLLDRWIEEAELDIRQVYMRRGRLKTGRTYRGLPRWGAFKALSRKLANLQPLRFDALFILENLENSSRIIGDYYLEKIYDHLCGMFNTNGWKANVERRLEILQNIYAMAKTDLSDRTMLILEFLVALMIAVELVAFFAPLLAR